MERWHAKVAVVTGASAGIGAAIAEKLVENNLQVVGLARRKDRIEELSKKLEERNASGKLYAYRADLTKTEDILSAFKWVTDHVGPISILVNNAGLHKCTNLIDGNIKDWKTVLDTNVLAVAICTREAISSMKMNDINGHIININSIAGHNVFPLPYNNVYPASKYAVTALTETLRLDLKAMGSKIKVTSISPGAVDTEIFEVSGVVHDETVAKILSITPTLKSEDIANAVLYVLGTPPTVMITELTIKPVGEII